MQIVQESQIPTGVHTRVFLGATKAAPARNGIDPSSLGREAYVLRSVGDDLMIVGPRVLLRVVRVFMLQPDLASLFSLKNMPVRDQIGPDTRLYL